MDGVLEYGVVADGLAGGKGGMTQLNTRIERELKDRGDEALRNAGYSSSAAVRKLWEFAARHRHDPQGIRDVLEEGSSVAAGEWEIRLAQARDEAERGPSLLAQGLRRLGIASSGLADASYEDLREQALWDRLGEGGLA